MSRKYRARMPNKSKLTSSASALQYCLVIPGTVTNSTRTLQGVVCVLAKRVLRSPIRTHVFPFCIFLCPYSVPSVFSVFSYSVFSYFPCCLISISLLPPGMGLHYSAKDEQHLVLLQLPRASLPPKSLCMRSPRNI